MLLIFFSCHLQAANKRYINPFFDLCVFTFNFRLQWSTINSPQNSTDLQDTSDLALCLQPTLPPPPRGKKNVHFCCKTAWKWSLTCLRMLLIMQVDPLWHHEETNLRIFRNFLRKLVLCWTFYTFGSEQKHDGLRGRLHHPGGGVTHTKYQCPLWHH